MRAVWGVHDVQGGSDTRPSGCGFYRIVLPFDQLAANGWDARYRAGTPPPESENAQILVGERLDKHDGQGAWRRLRLRHKLVYEIDDDVYHVDRMNTMAWNVYGRPAVQEVVTHLMNVSDLVTVTSEPLAEVMREHNPNVAVIPNFIPADMLAIERPRREKLTVGWTGGGSHALDLMMIAEPLRRFLDTDRRDAQLHIVGSDFRRTVGHMNARFTDWLPDPRDYYRVLDFDIGLAPLTGTTFDQSKSNIKALEYAALGIPVIASDVEPYRNFVIDGVTGFLVRKKNQWRQRLRELAADPDLRESMGAKAREIARGWTIEKNWHHWDRAYSSLL